MNKGYHWTTPSPTGHARQEVELVAPDGTLCGVTLRTLENAWGAYQDKTRADIEKRIIRLLNEGRES